MNDDLVPVATPAPAAPAETPAAPPSPAPETPPAPTPEAAPPTQPTPEQVEDAEWADAAKEVLGVKPEKEATKDEPAKPEEGAEKKPQGEAATADQKQDAKPGDGDDDGAAAKVEAPAQPDDAARSARQAARSTAEQAKAVAADVRAKMFTDVPTVLQDADGDPIHTIEDVQKLINPRTNEPFTEEEAGMWLLAAQQQFNQKQAEVDKQIEHIADVNMTIKDEAAYVNSKYGELLKSNTQLRDRLWAQFEKTLVQDKTSGVIVDMPVSLEEFYDTALTPYLEVQATKQQAAEAATKAAADAEAAKKAEAEKARKQARSDRSDIYAPSNDSQVDEETKEWAEAANAVFGNQLPKK